MKDNELKLEDIKGPDTLGGTSYILFRRTPRRIQGFKRKKTIDTLQRQLIRFTSSLNHVHPCGLTFNVNFIFAF
jgi:hypothetical protein